MRCAAATTRRPCFFFAGVKTPLHEILIKFLSCVRTLRARQEIRCAFWRERRAGRCEAPRRRRCRCASSRSGNKADARPPPRPSGLRPAGPLAVLLAPYIPHRVCSSLAPCQRAWGPAAKCTPYFLTGPWPPISQIRRKDLPQISRITRVFEFFGPLAVWLQIKPIVRQQGGSFRLIRLIRGQASFGFLVGKRFVILRVFASSRGRRAGPHSEVFEPRAVLLRKAYNK